jgi:hypothetical protein
MRDHAAPALLGSQLFFAPATTQASSGHFPAVGREYPKVGMFPPYQVKHDPVVASFEVVPLM